MKVYKGLIAAILLLTVLLVGCGVKVEKVPVLNVNPSLGETNETFDISIEDFIPPIDELVTITTMEIPDTATTQFTTSTELITAIPTVTTTTTTTRPTTTTTKAPTTTAVTYTEIYSMEFTDYWYSTTMVKGEKLTLELEVWPSNANEPITWSSSNPAVATVDQNGVVTGVSVGDTTISVKTLSGDCSTSLDVTVQQYSSLTDIEFKNYSETVFIGKTLALKYTKTPAAATEPITWSSSDTAVATVDQNGVVTGVSEGSVTIRAEGFYGDEYDTISVTVKKDVLGKCSLTVPEMPQEVHYYYSSNVIKSTFKITDIRYEFVVNDYQSETVTLELFFTGEKTYDKDGAESENMSYFSLRLKDTDGYLIRTDVTATPLMRQGEKVKDSGYAFYSLPAGAYVLELSNYG